MLIVIDNPPELNAHDTIELIAGDDYFASDNRSIGFKSSLWPSLAGAQAAFNVSSETDFVNYICGAPCTVADGNIVMLELPASQTSKLPVDDRRTGTATFRFALTALLANGHFLTLATGMVTAIRRAGN